MWANTYVVVKARELELDRLARRPHIEQPRAPYDRLLPAFDDDRGLVRRAGQIVMNWARGGRPRRAAALLTGRRNA